MWSEHRLLSSDATPLFYRRHTPPGGCRARVLMLHGLGEHGGRYRPVADYLGGLGLEALIPDLRGYGHSGGKPACVRRFSDYHRDLETFHAWLLRQDKSLPVFFLGHSFGALVMASYLAGPRRGPVAGLVMSSPLFQLAGRVPLWRRALARMASVLVPDLTQTTGIAAHDLTHDRDVLGRYAADPLIHQRISARLYSEMSRMMALKDYWAGRLKLPALILQAGDDRVVSADAARGFFHALASADKEIEIYEGFFHEILNETGRDRVLGRIGAWLSARIP